VSCARTSTGGGSSAAAGPSGHRRGRRPTDPGPETTIAPGALGGDRVGSSERSMNNACRRSESIGPAGRSLMVARLVAWDRRAVVGRSWRYALPGPTYSACSTPDP
jgi:hypothetical protein